MCHDVCESGALMAAQIRRVQQGCLVGQRMAQCLEWRLENSENGVVKFCPIFVLYPKALKAIVGSVQAEHYLLL